MNLSMTRKESIIIMADDFVVVGFGKSQEEAGEGHDLIWALFSRDLKKRMSN